jgi:hypothetical protein
MSFISKQQKRGGERKSFVDYVAIDTLNRTKLSPRILEIISKHPVPFCLKAQ